MDEEHQLIQECAANNRLSQEKLYRKFYPSLILLCKRFCSDNHEALEILNDGMMKVFKNIAGYDASRGSFFNWVYTIVRNTALDKLKLKPYNAPQELNEYMNETSIYNPLAALEWKDVYILLDTLSPATRVVCSLYYLEGFSIKDIGEKLLLSSGTVKWHLSETRKNLKPVFKKYYS